MLAPFIQSTSKLYGSLVALRLGLNVMQYSWQSTHSRSIQICTLDGDDFFTTVFFVPGLFGFLVIFPPRTFFGEAFVFIGFEAFSTGAKISLNTILFIANFDLIHLNIFVSVALMAILNWQRSGST